jgi:hypothetical protein
MFSKISPVIENVVIVAGVLITIYVPSGIAILLWDTFGELGMLITCFLMLLVLLCCLLDEEKETRSRDEQRGEGVL